MQILKSTLLTVLLVSGMNSVIVADELEEISSNNSFFIGGNTGLGSGTVKYTYDGNTVYEFENGDLKTTDYKFYIGYNHGYGFIQTGTIDLEAHSEDLDYMSFGIGYLHEIDTWKIDLGILNITPQFDAEIGYDTTSGTNDLDGLLLSLDAGLGFSLNEFQNLKFTTDIGYDVHVLNDGVTEGTWNLHSYQFNLGLRYIF
jgi:hypothetical protein